MNRVIRTIGGDLPTELAGPVYAHEHLIVDSPIVARTMPHIHLHSEDEAVAEVRTCVGAGIRTMVEVTPAAFGRDPERLSRVSVLTGMRIVSATGLHAAKHYDDVPWAQVETAEQLAERFVADIEQGIDLHDYRGESVERSAVVAGIVKVASSAEQLTDREQRLFEAAAMTVARTGVPVMTHAEGGLGGMQQIEMLTALGIAPERIALSHTDKVADPGYHRAMLESGVLLCYDQGLRNLEATTRLIDRAIDDGFGRQIILGTDGARRSLWKSLGGSPGLGALYRSMPDVFDLSVTRSLFVDNPARYLTMERRA